ncbi:hypothetical protein [Microterricola pindariensis]|uniref:hypothetical protein n=1 Tax=Microterricola pindariensis TaxID=478010 RepID=UPI001374A4DB|nr:hypothetical protein [Microterricola pindariensis]
MTQEMWWIPLSASGLLVPMLLGLVAPRRRAVPVRVARQADPRRDAGSLRR